MPLLKTWNVPRVCAATVLITLGGTAAAASSLSIGPRGVQTLVAEQLFSRAGRWYLSDDGGVCYTYLESPRTVLQTDRLVLHARLRSRMGQRVGNRCAGLELVSNITLSGKLRGSVHKIVLDDIRIDEVDDDTARNALKFAQQLAPDSIPRSVSLDVLDLVRRQIEPAAKTSLHLTQIHIVDITTQPAAVVVAFDLGLSMP